MCVCVCMCVYYTSPPDSSWTPGVFYTYFYNHAHRLRLEKILYLELSRSPNGFFKALLDPGGGFTSETATLAKANGFILVWGSLTVIISVRLASSDPAALSGPRRIRGADIIPYIIICYAVPVVCSTVFIPRS
jgi:hypothetical protein